MVRTDPDLLIREFVAADTEALVELLLTSFPAWPQPGVLSADRPVDFFRWKHLLNPAGRSLIMVGERDRQIVAMRAYMPWSLAGGANGLEARQGVDLATHPDYRGRGISHDLTRRQLDRYSGVPPMTLSIPNPMSQAQTQRLGWRVVTKVPVWVQLRRPLRAAANLRRLRPQHSAGPAPDVEAASAVDVLSAREDVGDLLRDADSVVVGYRSRPDVDSLLWRYDRCLADYRAVAEHRAGRLDGLAIFRCRRRGALWELSVCELFVRPGDDEMARRLLRRVAQSAQVDYVAVVAGASLPGALLTRAGYVRSPVGRIPVGVIPYEQYELDPTSPSSWSMSLGDLERLQLC